MRSFLGFVVFVAALVALLGVVVVPLVARPLIASVVRDALPLTGPPVQVEVDAGPALLGGTVERIAVRGDTLASGETTIGSLDVEARRFSILARSFEALAGTLGDVVLRLEDGTLVVVRSVDVAGSSETMTATATLDAAATEQLIRSSLASGGIVPDRVVLGRGSIAIEVRGLQAAARFEARNGALVLVPDQLLPPLAILVPDADDPWRLTGATVSPAGLVLVAEVDAEALLGR